jgi:hypothetical protein
MNHLFFRLLNLTTHLTACSAVSFFTLVAAPSFSYALSPQEESAFVESLEFLNTSEHDCQTKTCAEASIEKSGYVYSDCLKVKNAAQDTCAATTIEKSGYVYSDCLKLEAGGACATISIQKSGYIYSDCLKIKSYAGDRCAKASIERSGYVYGDCLKL